MTKVREHLSEALRKEIGECADPADVVSRLYDLGALDDSLSRRAVVRAEFPARYASCDRSAREIHGEIADEYGLSRERVGQLLRSGK
jgi:hypothetical protein